MRRDALTDCCRWNRSPRKKSSRAMPFHTRNGAYASIPVRAAPHRRRASLLQQVSAPPTTGTAGGWKSRDPHTSRDSLRQHSRVALAHGKFQVRFLLLRRRRVLPPSDGEERVEPTRFRVTRRGISHSARDGGCPNHRLLQFSPDRPRKLRSFDCSLMTQANDIERPACAAIPAAREG